MGLSNLGERIGKFFFTLGFICAICLGLIIICKVGVETIKEKVTTAQETSAAENQTAQESSQK